MYTSIPIPAELKVLRCDTFQDGKFVDNTGKVSYQRDNGNTVILEGPFHIMIIEALAVDSYRWRGSRVGDLGSNLVTAVFYTEGEHTAPIKRLLTKKAGTANFLWNRDQYGLTEITDEWKQYVGTESGLLQKMPITPVVWVPVRSLENDSDLDTLITVRRFWLEVSKLTSGVGNLNNGLDSSWWQARRGITDPEWDEYYNTSTMLRGLLGEAARKLRGYMSDPSEFFDPNRRRDTEVEAEPVVGLDIAKKILKGAAEYHGIHKLKFFGKSTVIKEFLEVLEKWPYARYWRFLEEEVESTTDRFDWRSRRKGDRKKRKRVEYVRNMTFREYRNNFEVAIEALRAVAKCIGGLDNSKELESLVRKGVLGRHLVWDENLGCPIPPDNTDLGDYAWRKMDTYVHMYANLLPDQKNRPKYLERVAQKRLKVRAGEVLTKTHAKMTVQETDRVGFKWLASMISSHGKDAVQKIVQDHVDDILTSPESAAIVDVIKRKGLLVAKKDDLLLLSEAQWESVGSDTSE